MSRSARPRESAAPGQTVDPSALAAALARAISVLGLTKAQVARRAQIEPSHLHKILRGTVQPRRRTVEALEAAIGVKLPGSPKSRQRSAMESREGTGVGTPRSRAATPTYWAGRPAAHHESFYGRDARLRELDSLFAHSTCVVVSGGPGMGKTRLATEWATGLGVPGFWTAGGSTADQTLAALAGALDIAVRGLADGEVVADVRLRLAQQPAGTVWVVDHLKHLTQVSRLLEGAPAVRVLITTRDCGLRRLPPGVGRLRLDTLETDAAVLMLRSRGGGGDDETLRDIAHAVGCLPMALEVLAVRLAGPMQTAGLLAREIEQAPSALELEVFRQDAQTAAMSRTDGVLAALTGSIHALSRGTRALLAPFGYLADAPVPLDLARTLAGGDESALGEMLIQCEHESVAMWSPDGVIIHSLVAAAIRSVDRGRSLRDALWRAEERLSRIKEVDPVSVRGEIAHHGALLSHAMSGAGERAEEWVLPYANLVVSAYRTLGRDEEAAALGEETLRIKRRVLGPERPDALATRDSLAIERPAVPTIGSRQRRGGTIRIGMIAPLEIRVPPVAYGGTELVVSLLTEELVRRGHDVTLFASGDSLTAARLVPGSPRFLRGTGLDKGVLETMNVVSCMERAGEFDIIHNHNTFAGMGMAGLVDTPVLTTLHGFYGGDSAPDFDRYRGWYNTTSHSAKSLLPPRERFAGVIHSSIDCASFPFNGGGREEYLLFLSRLSPEKGPHLAIDVARRTGQRLVIAGNVDGWDREFFERSLLPAIDGDQIKYVGEADSAQKRALMSQARCLLAPITWEEPFGLFMVEAMACGTPVIAMRRGAAPEVVEDGVTGFIVDTVEEMAEAVGRVDDIDSARCREHVEQHFDVPRMADDYLAAYERVMEGQGARRWRRGPRQLTFLPTPLQGELEVPTATDAAALRPARPVD